MAVTARNPVAKAPHGRVRAGGGEVEATRERSRPDCRRVGQEVFGPIGCEVDAGQKIAAEQRAAADEIEAVLDPIELVLSLALRPARDGEDPRQDREFVRSAGKSRQAVLDAAVKDPRGFE